MPTAAVTNLVNLLMEKIHEKYLHNMEEKTESPVYTNFIEKLCKTYKFKDEEFNIVAFGLPKTGKSVFGSILSGEKVLA